MGRKDTNQELFFTESRNVIEVGNGIAIAQEIALEKGENSSGKFKTMIIKIRQKSKIVQLFNRMSPDNDWWL